MLVEAITLYHMVIEGVLALTGQHFIIGYNTEQGTLPGFVAGFEKVARDEHRHVAFGARFLTDMVAESDRYRTAIQRMLAESLPVAERVFDPPYVRERRGLGALRLLKGGDAGLCGSVPDPAAQGHRPGLSCGELLKPPSDRTTRRTLRSGDSYSLPQMVRWDEEE